MISLLADKHCRKPQRFETMTDPLRGTISEEALRCDHAMTFLTAITVNMLHTKIVNQSISANLRQTSFALV